jgi:hypothetical protein
MRGVVRRSVRATSPLAGEGVTRSVTDEGGRAERDGSVKLPPSSRAAPSRRVAARDAHFAVPAAPRRGDPSSVAPPGRHLPPQGGKGARAA